MLQTLFPKRTATQILLFLVSAAVFQFMLSCSDSNSPTVTYPEGGSFRGRIISARQTFQAAKTQVQEYIDIFGTPVVATSGIVVYTVRYQTILPDGTPTEASGTVAFPDAVTSALPTLVFHHGTESSRQGESVPSANVQSLEDYFGSGTGYMVVQPDYIGLGVSTVPHPYLHAESQASAAIDLLKAARTLARDRGFSLSGKLFLTGYSQGGHAALATQKVLERDFSNEFTVTACAPAAGPYDMEETFLRFMRTDEIYPYPAFFGMLAVGFNYVYNDIPPYSQIFLPQYATTIPQLFNGTQDFWYLNSALPNRASALLQPSFINSMVNNPDFSFRRRLRENSLLDWSPKAPIRFYHCAEDEAVPVANSQTAASALSARSSSEITFISLPFGGHADCGLPAIYLAKVWFDGLR